MFTKRVTLFVLTSLIALLVACTGGGTEPAAQPESPVTTPTETPAPEAETPDVTDAAITQLAAQLDISPEEITVRSTESAEWPNACLGLAEAGEMCAEVITPGFLVILEAGDQVYEVRTDSSGDSVRFVETADPSEEYPVAVIRAKEQLAATRGVTMEAIDVLSFERREWSDSCLGLGGPAESCLQAITPGWLVMLNVDGEAVEVRTDESGNAVRIAGSESMPAVALPLPVTEAAVDAVAAEAKVAPEKVTILASEPRVWSDSCLGLGGPAESCLAAETPGWRVVAEADGQTYEVRTDDRGRAVRLTTELSETPAHPGRGLPAVVFMRSGGLAGERVQYNIFEDGVVEKLDVAGNGEVTETTFEVDGASVAELVADLEAAGFFELEADYLPEDTCCDRYEYTLTVTSGEQGDTVITMDDAGAPEALWQMIERVQSFLDEATAAASE